MSQEDLPCLEDPNFWESDSTVHRTASSIICLLWVPAGLVLWSFMAYCASGFVQASAAAMVYLSVQIGGNLAIGRMLDQRLGRRSGVMLATGRSVSSAIGLFVISLPLLYLHPGYAPNCG